MRTQIKIFLTLSLLFLFSCGEEKPEVRTDTDALKKIINLNTDPVAVKWAYTQLGDGGMGPKDYTVTAVIKLSASDWKKLQEEHLKQVELNKDLAPDFVADWYSKSVKDCFKNHGDHVSVETYPVASFQKSPFLNGFCFFTNNNEVFIYMHTD